MDAASYDKEAYDSLPGLSAASRRFQGTDAKAIIDGPLRDLFLTHEVHKDYGITLPHQHFPMGGTKRLVEYHNVSTPWETGHDTNVITAKYDGFIVPRSFRYRENCFQPYEFGFSTTKPFQTLNEQFAKDLAMLLQRHGMDEILGLRELEQRNSNLSLEVTEGNANIMMVAGAVPTDSLIEALWIFGVDKKVAGAGRLQAQGGGGAALGAAPKRKCTIFSSPIVVLLVALVVLKIKAASFGLSIEEGQASGYGYVALSSSAIMLCSCYVAMFL